MGYIINSEGKKIKVKNPNGDCAERVVLVNDNTILKNNYNLCIYEKDYSSINSDSELIAEILFEKTPTDEEVIFYMVKNGVNRYTGYAVIEEVKVLDFK